ncbi:MAG: hypothetical protein A2W82_03445 [Sulfurimonas sp. RIFCSPLOWO2_12_36_12]|uniref:hypothetical protein n=1 Tax=unclassified Sulfurimonas TaxID=2623549 RepID=UPI0008B30C4A|nr:MULTISPECIES: hypothetical protein [unclassified Sulfurimonas]OHE00014.1 MAG: hypothetical protein A2W82_03445 [Sulfurimonas sp. RIFCSPLOWO2_12_36_12]
MAQEQSYDIPLHDIKPIVEVQEYSLYYFLGATLFALILVLGAAYLIYMLLQKRNKFNIRKEHFKLLNSLDLSDAKRSAYDVTTYGATFKNDSPRHQEMYENLINRLEIYKYKKDVDAYDGEIIGYIELYKGMIDV